MDERISLILRTIHANTCLNVSLADLANIVKLSTSRLSHLFRQETGISLGRYVRTSRLTKAHDLLRTGMFSVEQVVASVGMGDRSHFIRAFRAQYRKRPSEVRSEGRSERLEIATIATVQRQNSLV